MCEETDLEGVRRWFYGGTPPGDECLPDGDALPPEEVSLAAEWLAGSSPWRFTALEAVAAA
jgi:hypothetical protein